MESLSASQAFSAARNGRGVISADIQHQSQLGNKALGHSAGHSIFKVGYALSAVLIVLVGLKRNAGQCAVTLDTLRLPQKTVPGIEAALKQLLDIDLTAGSRQGKEIKIVDVNIPILVSLTVFRLEHVHLIKLLGCFTAVLEHGAHGRIAVDIRILPLQIAFAGPP